jgi:hypothetical protein
LQLFQTLENELVNESRILFEHEPQNVFFQRSMHGDSCCLVVLKTPKNFTGAKLLLLQMDNCVKKNKNCHFFAFPSFLVAREVFEEVKLGF